MTFICQIGESSLDNITDINVHSDLRKLHDIVKFAHIFSGHILILMLAKVSNYTIFLPIPSSVKSIEIVKNMNPLAPSSGPAIRVLHQCLDLRKDRRLPAPS